jgi:hypothetical protein
MTLVKRLEGDPRTRGVTSPGVIATRSVITVANRPNSPTVKRTNLTIGIILGEWHLALKCRTPERPLPNAKIPIPRFLAEKAARQGRLLRFCQPSKFLGAGLLYLTQMKFAGRGKSYNTVVRMLQAGASVLLLTSDVRRYCAPLRSYWDGLLKIGFYRGGL